MSTYNRYLPFVSIILLACLSGPCAIAAQTPAAKSTKLSGTGKLVKVMAIGAETSGWSIKFEKETVVDGQLLHAIEVDAPADTLKEFETQRVNAKGTLTYRHGVERENYPVLQISKIRAAK